MISVMPMPGSEDFACNPRPMEETRIQLELSFGAANES